MIFCFRCNASIDALQIHPFYPHPLPVRAHHHPGVHLLHQRVAPGPYSHRRGLEDAEDIALSVLAVSQPPHARYLRFGLDDLALVGGHCLERLIDGLDPDGADISLDTVAGPRPLASQNAAVYSHLFPGAGHDQPVIEGAIPLGDLPAEYASVECGGALRVFGMDFKMNYSWHVYIIGAGGGYRFLSGGRRG